MGTCFVIQPFDKGDYDKRYKDIIEPAIKEVDLTPYRVDRDPGATIPSQEIERQIDNAEVCIADISEDLPNIWYEVGFAMALKKEVVLICNKAREDRQRKYPFDVQHRSIIIYQTGSPSDFDTLKKEIIEKLKVAKTRIDPTKTIRENTYVMDKEGFSQHEIAAMAIFIGESLTSPEGLTGHFLQEQMTKSGFTPAAASLGVKSLKKKGYIDSKENFDGYDNPYTAYFLTVEGDNWALENNSEFKIRKDVINEEIDNEEIDLDDLSLRRDF